MKFRLRRLIAILLSGAVLISVMIQSVPENSDPPERKPIIEGSEKILARDALDTLEQKGRAPKTGYERAAFGNGWRSKNGCDTRNIILNRDLVNVKTDDACHVVSGTLHDPYTGTVIEFERDISSSKVQIDHVVALSDAWQKGAQLLTPSEREELANDPLELLAVDGNANQKKSDGDAATWLPSNKAFRCEYIARQIAVKIKYKLWVTSAEYQAMKSVLSGCPLQQLP